MHVDYVFTFTVRFSSEKSDLFKTCRDTYLCPLLSRAEPRTPGHALYASKGYGCQRTPLRVFVGDAARTPITRSSAIIELHKAISLAYQFPLDPKAIDENDSACHRTRFAVNPNGQVLSANSERVPVIFLLLKTCRGLVSL